MKNKDNMELFPCLICYIPLDSIATALGTLGPVQQIYDEFCFHKGNNVQFSLIIRL